MTIFTLILTFLLLLWVIIVCIIKILKVSYLKTFMSLCILFIWFWVNIRILFKHKIKKNHSFFIILFLIFSSVFILNCSSFFLFNVDLVHLFIFFFHLSFLDFLLAWERPLRTHPCHCLLVVLPHCSFPTLCTCHADIQSHHSRSRTLHHTCRTWSSILQPSPPRTDTWGIVWT